MAGLAWIRWTLNLLIVAGCVAIVVVVVRPGAADAVVRRLSGPAVDAARFESLNRALTTIRTSTRVGVSYAAYGDQVRQLAVELEIAKGYARTKEEKSMIAEATAASAAYNDGWAAWQYQIQRGPVFSRDTNPELAGAAFRHRLTPHPQMGTFQTQDILQAAWVTAWPHVDAATKLYSDNAQAK